MKIYKKPIIVSMNSDLNHYKMNEDKSPVFPSLGALKGAAYMVARSAAKGGNFLDYKLPALQKVN